MKIQKAIRKFKEAGKLLLHSCPGSFNTANHWNSVLSDWKFVKSEWLGSGPVNCLFAKGSCFQGRSYREAENKREARGGDAVLELLLALDVIEGQKKEWNGMSFVVINIGKYFWYEHHTLCRTCSRICPTMDSEKDFQCRNGWRTDRHGPYDEYGDETSSGMLKSWGDQLKVFSRTCPRWSYSFCLETVRMMVLYLKFLQGSGVHRYELPYHSTMSCKE